MFDKIVAYLEKRMEANAINPDPFDRRQVAVAALLVEASRLDGHYDAVEQGTVIRLLRDTLKLPAEQARTLLSLAEVRQANTYDNWIFCEAIKRGYSIAERAEIVTDLWKVAFADGQLSRFEDEMIARAAKELGLSDAGAAEAKKAAQK
ncbi:MAG: TerB family tellurite resistance protein [Alphaproteobacteria bacterium]|nr:TerB family tellurite resistance protein [Alphaproteobacteria bacterium]